MRLFARILTVLGSAVSALALAAHPARAEGSGPAIPKGGTMRKFAIASLALLSVLVIGSSAGATNGGPLDCFPGCRINVRLGKPTTYPAGQPFVIAHGVNSGFVLPPLGTGMDLFALEIDGVPRAPDAIIRDAVSPPDLSPPPTFDFPYPGVESVFVFNFPAGMTGTHTFTGHWYEPCATAVALDGYPGPCETPAAQVQFETHSLTVTFTP